MPKWVAAEGMLFVQTLINFLIPSGSGQAATTIPIMAPLSDILGIPRQIAVLAYQFGDGFSNILWPTTCCRHVRYRQGPDRTLVEVLRSLLLPALCCTDGIYICSSNDQLQLKGQTCLYMIW
jgi:Predicted membrane protein